MLPCCSTSGSSKLVAVSSATTAAQTATGSQSVATIDELSDSDVPIASEETLSFSEQFLSSPGSQDDPEVYGSGNPVTTTTSNRTTRTATSVVIPLGNGGIGDGMSNGRWQWHGDSFGVGMGNWIFHINENNVISNPDNNHDVKEGHDSNGTNDHNNVVIPLGNGGVGDGMSNGRWQWHGDFFGPGVGNWIWHINEHNLIINSHNNSQVNDNNLTHDNNNRKTNHFHCVTGASCAGSSGGPGQVIAGTCVVGSGSIQDIHEAVEEGAVHEEGHRRQRKRCFGCISS